MSRGGEQTREEGGWPIRQGSHPPALAGGSSSRMPRTVPHGCPHQRFLYSKTRRDSEAGDHLYIINQNPFRVANFVLEHHSLLPEVWALRNDPGLVAHSTKQRNVAFCLPSSRSTGTSQPQVLAPPCWRSGCHRSPSAPPSSHHR